MIPVTRFACALLAIIALLITMALMDGPSDIQAAQDAADDYAQAVADGGRAKCAELGRVPRWTTDGDLVCRLPGVREAKL